MMGTRIVGTIGSVVSVYHCRHTIQFGDFVASNIIPNTTFTITNDAVASST